ncbi:Six-hairpin glycosidase [Pluteus cervinus]|uniref:Six-hairpin glycosidase n=1 Tax=Pluteus cervinus TaxID=181527 RepID=A0ACD3A5H8_9AGAR|nr:Six-hairpin glycosidase [Pluteus cervinus]
MRLKSRRSTSGLPRCIYLGLVSILAVAEGVKAVAPSGPWDAFNYAPASKTVYPTKVHSTSGFIQNPDRLVRTSSLSNTTDGSIEKEGQTTIAGGGSWIALDFGIEVGGLISMNFHTPEIDSSLSNVAPAPHPSISLSFTESPLFIRPNASDDSSYPSPNNTYDGILTASVPALPTSGNSTSVYWTQPSAWLRGGFRYLTISLIGGQDTELTISNVSCSISFMPHVEDLRAYSGYFYAPQSVKATGNEASGFTDPDFLTKIWYAGAYTVQTNTVPLDTGRQVPFAPAGTWANNARLGTSGPIIVDGAKRDRAVWPGDMGIAVPAQFVSTNDLISTRNALATMFSMINSRTGALPESGPPLSQQGSDTYHAWTLIGTDNYFLYSGDEVWLRSVWSNYTKAVAFLEGKVDSKVGLMNVTGLRDWARLGGGGYNAAGNALLYRVLITSAELADSLGFSSLSDTWSRNATTLKAKFNQAFWLESAGMYRDNQTTTLCPQDANSFAVLYGLTLDGDGGEDQKSRISEGLQNNWNDLGPVAPELPDTISPFIGGFELAAHFEAGEDERAFELLRRTWGYMLYTNLSVQSTLLEGFTANGSIGYRSYRGYNYDSAYTSHAHGWSAGPTSSLTFYLLGLTITSAKGSTWSVAPHFASASDLGVPAVEGGFETPLGWYGVKWQWKGVDTKNGAITVKTDGTSQIGSLKDVIEVEVDVQTPSGTSGVFRMPKRLAGFQEGFEVGLWVDGRELVQDNAGSGLQLGSEITLEGGSRQVLIRISRAGPETQPQI